MSYTLTVLVSIALGFVLGRWITARPFWKRVRVGDRFRGPNADTLYRGVDMQDHAYLFTVEETQRAKERAQKYIPKE